MRSGKLIGLLVAAAIVTVLWVEIRSEGRLIGACAREATALSRVSETVRESLYPDTDHFLGKALRIQEDANLKSLQNAFASAKEAASKCRATFLRDAALQAREMFLAAQEQRSLAGQPRGNWISFMSETTKARTQFETAQARYEIDRSALVVGDSSDEVDRAVQAAFQPLREEAERLEAAAAEQRVNQENEARERQAKERLRAETEKGPDREVQSADFEWTWQEDPASSSIKVTGFGKEVRTNRTFTLSFRNATPWRMYWVSVTPDGSHDAFTRPQLGPGEGGLLKLQVSAFAPKPSSEPLFSGTFSTAVLPKPSPTPNLQMAELIRRAVKFEEQVGLVNSSAHAIAGGPLKMTLAQALEQRSRIRATRDQAIAELKRWPERPDAAEVARHMRRAIATIDDSVECLDSIIARLRP